MSKKISDFFSPEARAARREARLNKVSSLSGTVGTDLGQRFASKAARITTQNVGPHGLMLVREILANYRLPGVPKLGYSGLRNGRTAANSTRLQDGVVTITASFKTYSNVGISFDVPIEIRDGVMQEPSVIVHNGAPRIIAQSTFDDLVSMNTMRDIVPVREMYSEPLPNSVAKKMYKERVEMPRVDRGMFSVDANKRNLQAAIRGTSIKTAQAQVSPTTIPMPKLKVPYHPGAWQQSQMPRSEVPTGSIPAQSQNKPPPPVPDGEEGTAVRQHQDVKQPSQGASNVPQQLGQMGQQLVQISQQLAQTKQAKEKEKEQKTPKLKAPKLPKLKAPPSTSRLCAKCSSAPCKCPNKRKKKQAIYRPIVAQMDMVSKVQAEVEQMRGDGLGDIDIKQAIFKKYGPGIAASIFPGE